MLLIHQDSGIFPNGFPLTESLPTLTVHDKGATRHLISDDNPYYWDGTAWHNLLGVSALGDIALTNDYLITGVGGVATAIPRSSLLLSDLGLPATNVAMNAKRLTGLADPVDDQDAVTKAFLLANAQGLVPKGTCKLKTNQALPACTYNTGTTRLTATSNGALSATLIDSAATGDYAYTLLVGDNVLVTSQATSSHNGPYSVIALGDASNPWILERLENSDTNSELLSAYLFVSQGSSRNTGWSNTSALSEYDITVPSGSIVFEQFSAAGDFVDGNGLELDGNVFHFATALGYDTGDIFYAGSSSTVSRLAIGSANRFSYSSGTAPAWSVYALPNPASTLTANGLLYASSTTQVSQLASANNSVLITDGSGVPSFGTSLPTGITIGSAYIYRAGGTDVPLADGGTNASLTAVNGGIVYSTATAFAILGAGTANRLLKSGGAGAPAWAGGWEINSSSHLMPVAGNTYDIGSAATPIRDLFGDELFGATSIYTNTGYIRAGAISGGTGNSNVRLFTSGDTISALQFFSGSSPISQIVSGTVNSALYLDSAGGTWRFRSVLNTDSSTVLLLTTTAMTLTGNMSISGALTVSGLSTLNNRAVIKSTTAADIQVQVIGSTNQFGNISIGGTPYATMGMSYSNGAAWFMFNAYCDILSAVTDQLKYGNTVAAGLGWAGIRVREDIRFYVDIAGATANAAITKSPLWRMTSTELRPEVTNTVDLGTNTYRVKNISGVTANLSSTLTFASGGYISTTGGNDLTIYQNSSALAKFSFGSNTHLGFTSGGALYIRSGDALSGTTLVGVTASLANFSIPVNATTEYKLDGNRWLYMPSSNAERGPWNPLWTAIAAGKPMLTDEQFETGLNIIRYNNSGSEKVTISHVTGESNVPNATGNIARISYDGTGTPMSDPTPGYGGFRPSVTINSAANRTFVQRFIAKIPVGYSIQYNQNSVGTDHTTYWLTPTAGTGKWETYIRVTHCGSTGSFGGFGHVSVTEGGANVAFDWDVACHNIYDVTDSAWENLNADYILDGTLPSDRLTGSYTGITEIGSLTSGVTARNYFAAVAFSGNTNTNAAFFQLSPSGSLSSTKVSYVMSLRNTSGIADESSGLLFYNYDNSTTRHFFNLAHNGGAHQIQLLTTATTAFQIQSTLATGTAPFSVASTTKVTNLNADLLDGLEAAAFALSGHTHAFSSLTGAISAAQLATGTPTTGYIPRYQADGSIAWTAESGVGAHTHSAADITSGNLDPLRLSGSYTGITAIGTLASLTVSGTATVNAIAVTSTAKVTNLNADKLDGLDSTAFSLSGHTHSFSELTGSISASQLATGTPTTGQIPQYQADGSIEWVDDNVGAHTHDASAIVSGILDTALISGAYTGITDVGTLTDLTVSGYAVVNSFNVGGVYASGKYLRSNGVTLVPSDLLATDLAGTIASARLSGAYGSVTGLGTLTGLNVDGPTVLRNSTSISLKVRSISSQFGNVAIGETPWATLGMSYSQGACWLLFNSYCDTTSGTVDRLNYGSTNVFVGWAGIRLREDIRFYLSTSASTADAEIIKTPLWVMSTSAFYPETNNVYDIGTSAKRVKKLWIVDGDISGSVNITGDLNVGSLKIGASANAGTYLRGDGFTFVESTLLTSDLVGVIASSHLVGAYGDITSVGGVAVNSIALNTRTVTGTDSITGGGDLTANRTFSLVNDSTSPGVSKYYGTDSGGTKGFFDLPSGGSSPDWEDVPGIRLTSAIAPTSGIGLELGYDSLNGYVQAYDRDTASYIALVLSAQAVYFTINGLGTAHTIDVNGGFFRSYTNGFVDSLLGYKYAGSAVSGKYLRGNGTYFVSSDLNASDLTGTISYARLTGDYTGITGVGTLANLTVSGTGTFNAIAVTSTTKVTNLNADRLDGLDSTAFALSGHTHAFSAITGSLSAAQLAAGTPSEGKVVKYVSGTPTWADDSTGSSVSDGDFAVGTTITLDAGDPVDDDPPGDTWTDVYSDTFGTGGAVWDVVLIQYVPERIVDGAVLTVGGKLLIVASYDGTNAPSVSYAIYTNHSAGGDGSAYILDSLAIRVITSGTPGSATMTMKLQISANDTETGSPIIYDASYRAMGVKLSL